MSWVRFGEQLVFSVCIVFEKRLRSEAHLSKRALVLARLSGRESVRLSAACKRESLNKATLG